MEINSENNVSSEFASPQSVSQLELPTPERLLPIGSFQKEGGGGGSGSGISMCALVERVRQAFGMTSTTNGIISFHH